MSLPDSTEPVSLDSENGLPTTASETEQGRAGGSDRKAYKLILSYDGSEFYGWQRQAEHRSVQEVVEQAIAETTGDERVVTLASSRTDTGVHAIGQCAVFRSSRWNAPAARLPLAINTKLPSDVAVRAASEVPMTFSPIRCAVSKRYRYRIYASRIHNPLARKQSWWVKRPLNLDAMLEASRALIGEHDFLSFQTTGSPRKKTVRHVHSIEIQKEPMLDGVQYTIDVEANGFLYNMMRNIAGSLALVGVGQRSTQWLKDALEARDRRATGPTAPPYGLCLMNIQFEPGSET